MIGAADTTISPAAIHLNSNESVYGPSPHAAAAARAAVAGIERYLEDPDAALAPAIARRFGLQADLITIGQGSDDLLARLARAYLGPGTELMRSVNGYLKVPNYAYANDAALISVPDDNFKPSVDRMIAAISERTRIIYIASPENPAGTYLSGVELRRLHAAMPNDALLVIDSAYEEYVDAPDYEPAHKLVEESGNVVMCRTFSKIFGLAGARVGWAYGPDDVIDTLRRIALTFPVASPSAAAAIAALEDHAHTSFVRSANLGSRTWLTSELEGLGLQVVPSQANFVLVKFPNPEKTAEAADAALRARGISVRRFASPAFHDFIRITIGRPEELRACVAVISSFLIGDG
ncbi:aminotransferase class I/II-fold pyridoxal phosphate-dependent enzyme [Defluviimonas sp. WL0075]|uniref:Aminotransferase class I/II-fold pyridoxal phosphate-dependent enzyme n=2 Tax=Albidovulum sediminicola TaxID=2984331 RepID=A0ABT2Z5F8_9RHOB|nr:aminotransferase class I/II-fold pyridoxal phosphate-dependent enzyme [Defluviimonas sp. WL0075]